VVLLLGLLGANFAGPADERSHAALHDTNMLTRPLSALLLLLATPTAADIFAAVGNDSPLEIQNALECVPSTTRQPPTHAQLTLTLCPHRRAGAALNGKGPGGQTPLMNAVLMGKLDAVEALLSAGADVTIPEKDGYTPMHGAGFQGRAEIAKALIKHGVDPSDMHCALPLRLDSSA